MSLRLSHNGLAPALPLAACTKSLGSRPSTPAYLERTAPGMDNAAMTRIDFEVDGTRRCTPTASILYRAR